MLSSISTKPDTVPSASPSVVLITGAICTRSNWPARVVVTKLAIGWELWRRMRSWMLSRAWTIRLRSKTR
jgi:hypothetical protein